MARRDLLLIGIVPLLVLSGVTCGVRSPVKHDPTRPSPDPSIRLLSPHGFASGCPVAPDTIITARHMVLRPTGNGFEPVNLIWIDGEDRAGSTSIRAVDTRRDVAWIAPDRPLTRTIARASAPPAIGTRVRLTGYDSRRALAPRTTETTILFRFGPVLVLKDPAEPGWSGTCIVDVATREAVGIQVWLVWPFGIAMGIWGEWGEAS